MRYLDSNEIASVSGAGISANVLRAMWSSLGDFTSVGFYTTNISKIDSQINQVGLATVDTNSASSDWSDSKMGDAGWTTNSDGQTVKWFNNGMFMAFDIA